MTRPSCRTLLASPKLRGGALILFLNVVSGANGAWGQSPSLSATVSRDNVEVAEPFELHLTCTAPDGFMVQFPTVSERLGDFEVTSHRDQFDIPSADGRRYTRIYTLECLLAGERQVPAQTVQLRVGDAAPITLRSEPVTMHVNSSLTTDDAPNQFRDLQPIQDVTDPPQSSSGWQDWRWWSAAVLIPAVAWFAVRRKRVDALKWADAKLVRLAAALDQDGIPAQVVLPELVSIVKQFFQLHLGTATSSATSAELVQLIEPWAPADALQRLTSLVQQCDDACYAAAPFSADELRAAIQDGHQIVQQLAAIPTEPSPPSV